MLTIYGLAAACADRGATSFAAIHHIQDTAIAKCANARPAVRLPFWYKLTATNWHGRKNSLRSSVPRQSPRVAFVRPVEAVVLQYDDDELIRVTVGSLDRPEDIRPAGHYGVESRVAWANIGVGLPEEQTKEKF